MIYKSKYFQLSTILLLLLSFKVYQSFDAIRLYEHSQVLGPAIVFFYLTYISDVFLYFYYLKNEHLSKKIRDVVISLFRLGLTACVWIMF